MSNFSGDWMQREADDYEAQQAEKRAQDAQAALDAQKAREAAAAEQARSETQSDPYGVGQGSGFRWFGPKGGRSRRSQKSKRSQKSRRSRKSRR